MKSEQLKLRIDPVPSPLWKVNLRSPKGIGDSRFRRLRQEILSERGPDCSICGSPNKPELHEVWEYKEAKSTGTALLTGVEIVCKKCHCIHHWFRTEQWANDDGKADLKAHFMSVNGCSEAAFIQHRQVMFQEHLRRSQKLWSVDWGKFAEVTVSKE
jgi:hypothetical protein